MLRIPSLRLLIGRLPDGFGTVASGSIWLAIAAVLGQGSMLVANLTVANLLGTQGYGRYALLQSTVLLLSVLAQFSFPIVLAQQVAKLHDRDVRAASEITAFGFLFSASLSLALGAGLLLFRQRISADLFRDPVQAKGLIAIAVAVPCVAATSIQQGVFIGLRRFRDQATISFILVPLVIALPAVGAWFEGFAGAAAGLAAAYFLRLLVGQVMLRRVSGGVGFSWSVGDLQSKFVVLRRMALPATMAGGIIALANWGGQTLLSRSTGGATVVGLFAAAFAIKTMVMFIPSQMILALLPVLSKSHSTDSAGSRRLLWFNALASFGITIAICAVGVVLAPWVMKMFGGGFAGGAPVLRVLLTTAPIEAVTITLNQDLQARGHFWRGFCLTMLPVSLTTLSLALYLVPSLMALGLAYAWMGGWSLGLLATFIGVQTARGETSTEAVPR